jgi:hypothetical protein
MQLASFGLRSRWEHVRIEWASLLSLLLIAIIYYFILTVRKKIYWKTIREKITWLFKRNKFGYILFSFGTLTLPYLLFVYIVGNYGGTSQTPGEWVTLYYLFELIATILLPLTLISFFIMKFSSLLLVIVSYLIELGKFELIRDPWDLSGLDGYSFFILMLVIALEWYIFAASSGNIARWFYNKHKGAKR